MAEQPTQTVSTQAVANGSSLNATLQQSEQTAQTPENTAESEAVLPGVNFMGDVRNPNADLPPVVLASYDKEAQTQTSETLKSHFKALNLTTNSKGRVTRKQTKISEEQLNSCIAKIQEMEKQGLLPMGENGQSNAEIYLHRLALTNQMGGEHQATAREALKTLLEDDKANMDAVLKGINATKNTTIDRKTAEYKESKLAETAIPHPKKLETESVAWYMRPVACVGRAISGITGGASNMLDGLFDFCTGDFARGSRTFLTGLGNTIMTPFNATSNLIMGKDLMTFDHGLKQDADGMYQGGWLSSWHDKGVNAIAGALGVDNAPVQDQNNPLLQAGAQYTGIASASASQAVNAGVAMAKDNVNAQLEAVSAARVSTATEATVQPMAKVNDGR